MLTFPESTSSIAGTIRAPTPARRAISKTERTVSPRAEGMAMSASSTACARTAAGRSRRTPSTGRPTKVTPRFDGSSSRKPTGSRPASAWRNISLAMSSPASPAPTISTRFAGDRVSLPSVRREKDERTPPSWRRRMLTLAPPQRSTSSSPSMRGILLGSGKAGVPRKKEAADAAAVNKTALRAIPVRSRRPIFRHDWRKSA